MRLYEEKKNNLANSTGLGGERVVSLSPPFFKGKKKTPCYACLGMIDDNNGDIPLSSSLSISHPIPQPSPFFSMRAVGIMS